MLTAGTKAKSRAVAVSAVLLPSPAEPAMSPFRWLYTTNADKSSTTLSPPKARSAKLPETTPTPIEPATSATIQSELKYSMERARLSLPLLHSTWLAGQQHPTQFVHWSGVEQPWHESSAQPQELQGMAIAAKNERLPADRAARLIKLVHDRAHKVQGC